MSKTLVVFLLLFFVKVATAQSFECDRGGYYFFAPTKHGFIGLSTVAINMGIGEYVSSGNTIITYSKTGEKLGLNSVDCKDGLAYGLANERNDFSYLFASFINAKNSFYRLVLYQVERDSEVDKVLVNVKSQFSEILGRGKYILDLKYAFATHNAFVFVFSKYQDGIETFYLAQVKNTNDEISVEEMNITLDDKAHKTQKVSDLKYAYNGKGTLSVMQLEQDRGLFDVRVKDFDLSTLKEKSSRVYKLGFIGKDFFLCPSAEDGIMKVYESFTASMIDRDWKSIDDYLQFDFVNDELAIIGLFYAKKSSALVGKRADGLFMVKLNNSVKSETIKKPSGKIEFKYGSGDKKTPEYTFMFSNKRLLLTLWYPDKKNMFLYDNGDKSSTIDLKKGNPEVGLIKYFDSRNIISGKYLRADRANLYQTVSSCYSLYNLKENSVGFYTHLSIKKF